MKAYVYCKPTAKGIHSFYLVFEGENYFLFSQKYRKGVQRYFSSGVSLRQVFDIRTAHYDEAIIRTMKKLPVYLRRAEKENYIAVLDQTIAKERRWNGSRVA